MEQYPMEQAESTEQKHPRHRSPAWPFIPLSKAIERASDFYRSHRDRSVTQQAANVSWGMKPTSGGGPQTTAALKHYGLMEDGDDGIKLSDLGLRIVRDVREVSPDRDAALRDAALRPTVFAEIWHNWGDSLKEADVEFYLVHERRFSEDAAKGVLANYKLNVRYAKPLNSGNSSLGDTGRGVVGENMPPVDPAIPLPAPIKLMEGERVVFTHEIEPAHGVRIVVSGDVDESMLDALELYIQLQKKRLERDRNKSGSE